MRCIEENSGGGEGREWSRKRTNKIR